MATKQDSAPVNLDETLNKTDLGQVINDNKKIIMWVLGIILAAIVGYTVFNSIQKSNKQEKLNKAYTIQEEVFVPFLTGKVKSPAFIESLKAIPSQFVGSIVLVPNLLESIKKLYEENTALVTGNIDLIEKWHSDVRNAPQLNLLFSLTLVAIYEDSGQWIKAITVLEQLITQKNDVLKSKLYLDLGRAYMNKGDKAKALSSFEYILDKYPNSEEVRLAKLYLNKIN